MTKFSRLTLATLLMGSLALPALAQGTTSQAVPQKETAATAVPVAPKHHAMKLADRTGVHKAASTTETVAPVGKPAPATTAVVPSKDAKPTGSVVSGATVTGKEAAKDGAKAPAAVTKTN